METWSPEALKSSKIPVLQQVGEMSVPAAMLMILDHVQRVLDTAKEPSVIQQVLLRLQRLLDTLPQQENIIEELAKDDTPLEVKMRRITRRLSKLRNQLEKSREIEEQAKEATSYPANPIIEAFAERQKQLFLEEEQLKKELVEGKDVLRALEQVRLHIREVSAEWRAAVQEMNRKKLSPEKLAELDDRLQKAFEADPDVKRSLTDEERAVQEKTKEKEVEKWLQSLQPQAVELVIEAAQSHELVRKNLPYRFRRNTEAIVQQSLELLQELGSRNHQLTSSARERIRDRLSDLLRFSRVPPFLERAQKTTEQCSSIFSHLEPGHPLFSLGEKIRELHENLPVPELEGIQGFTRDQLHRVLSQISSTLSVLEDPEEKLLKLRDEILRKSMNPFKGPTKSRVDRYREQWNSEKGYMRKRAKKEKKGRRKEW